MIASRGGSRRSKRMFVHKHLWLCEPGPSIGIVLLKIVRVMPLAVCSSPGHAIILWLAALKLSIAYEASPNPIVRDFYIKRGLGLLSD